MKHLTIIIVWLTIFAAPCAFADAVDIYWIDVEGGASTLVVTAGGESVLMDAGWAGFEDRDAKRIELVLKQAGVTTIDYFITSHFHRDHVGGIATLSRQVEIREFLDHGDSVDKESERGAGLWKEYLATVDGRRRTVKPGDTVALTGAELIIVAAHSRALARPLAGSELNPLCDSYEAHPADEGENGKSVGYVLEVDGFRFLNLGDLSWNFQHTLACPVNMLGKIDLFQVTHHGVRDDVLPQQMWSVEPRVAVLNNGPRKGGGAPAVETVLASPGLEDMWQLHWTMENDAEHNADKRLTANLTETEDCEGHWLHAQVHDDGSFTITNGRNGFEKSYRRE